MKKKSNDCLYAARAILSGTDEAIVDGALLVREGGVEAIGRRKDFPAKPDYPVCDLGEAVLAPGLVNAHAHLEYGACRGRLKPSPFSKWLPEMIALRRSLGQEEIAQATKAGIKELVRGGVTTIGDISTYGLSPKLLAASGLRYRVFHELLSMTPPPYDDLFEPLEKKLEITSPKGLGGCGLAPHAPHTVARPLMEALRKRFHAVGLPFAIHAAESRSEISCLKQHRGDFFRLFRKIGFYPSITADFLLAESPLDFLEAGRPDAGPRDLIIHGNYLTSKEIKILAEKEQSVLVVCPGTRRFHGVSTPVLDQARRSGLDTALGTDSLASNEALDMWAEMRGALAMAKNWSPRDAWRAATLGGAKALGLEGRVGQLSPGYRADFMAIETSGDQLKGLGKAKGTSLFQSLLEDWLSLETGPRILGAWVEGQRLFDSSRKRRK